MGEKNIFKTKAARGLLQFAERNENIRQGKLLQVNEFII